MTSNAAVVRGKKLFPTSGAVAVVLVGIFWVALPAGAQVLSPGPLSKAHAALDSMASCTACHGDGAQHSNARCNACHQEIASRQSRAEGLHGRGNVKEQLCASCHHEHRGRDTALIDWGGSKRAFSHVRAGWPLTGEHDSVKCDACHNKRLATDADARAVFANRPDTLLGLSTRCNTCHFDEHRGQEGERCERCHTPARFKPSPLFDHRRDADFALTGRHQRVQCEKCHNTVQDETNRADAFPKPKHPSSYMQMKDIPHAGCISCHDDVHNGQLGKGCAQCHSTEGWKVIKEGPQSATFHDKTKFPLRGQHVDVACKECHGPFPGEKAVFKGLKHNQCVDCHMDAHVGQVAAVDGAVRCDACHDVRGFVPVTFDVAAHDKTRYPLAGAHGAVACAQCHVDDAKLQKRVPVAVRRTFERRKRKLAVSPVMLDLPQATERCESCHKDPHGGQFDARVKEKGCNSCHVVEAFTQVSFNHDESRFPLTGKHAGASCASCHVADPSAKGPKRDIVLYRPLATACAVCHRDVHVGQLAKDGDTDCARCHQTAGFAPATFDHATQSVFPLEGKHAAVACARCHDGVAVGDATITRYKPVPTSCAGCHADQHGGRFDGYTPP